MPSFLAAHPGRFDAFVFDAYGTLLDVHAAVGRHAGAIGPEARAFSELWRAKQLEYTWSLSLAGAYEPFAALTERALDHALARFPAVDPALRGPLLDAYTHLDAYPDAAPLLARLRAAGRRTAVLSNGDPAMLDAALGAGGLAPALDAVISADEARVFKTSPAVYALVQPRLGTPPERVAFVSSNRWDVAGATAFGFACVWVNRAGLPGEYPGLEPLATVADLGGVA